MSSFKFAMHQRVKVVTSYPQFEFGTIVKQDHTAGEFDWAYLVEFDRFWQSKSPYNPYNPILPPNTIPYAEYELRELRDEDESCLFTG